MGTIHFIFGMLVMFLLLVYFPVQVHGVTNTVKFVVFTVWSGLTEKSDVINTSETSKFNNSLTKNT